VTLVELLAAARSGAPLRAIGLMSGTAADGIDAALVTLWREAEWPCARLEAFHTFPYPPAVRAALFDAFAGKATVRDLCRLQVEVGEAFAGAAEALLAEAGVARIDFVASHGQTIWHEPPGSLQWGEPSLLAERLGCVVVADFRPRDLAAGGQGAPLIPYVDWLLFRHADRTRAVQNIGGMANVTCLPGGAGPEGVIAFDTGPGNAPIDAAVAAITAGRERFDRDGALAAAGSVDAQWLRRLMAHPFFHQPPPKSCGREQFGSAWVHDLAAAGLQGNDLVATLTALVVESIADAYRRWLPPVDEVIVGGGGARNGVLMRWLADRLAPARILTHEAFGWDSDAKEALGFAILGYETLAERPASLPAVTGARHPVILGKIVPGPPDRSARP